MLLESLRSEHIQRKARPCIQWKPDREERLKTAKKMSLEDKCNLNSVLAELSFFSQFFSLPKECCFTMLVAHWIEQWWENATFTLEWKMRSRCLSLSQKQSIFCGLQCRLLIIFLSWVASKGKMFSLWKDSDHKSNWSQLEQTARLPADVFHHTSLKTKMRHLFCFLHWKVGMWVREMEQSFQRQM